VGRRAGPVAVKEDRSTESKETYDGSPAARLHLVKEAVAFANSGGGTIVFGIADDGRVVGVGREVVQQLDAAQITDLMGSFTMPDVLDIDVDIERVDDAQSLVRVNVHAARQPPIVMAKDGNRQDATGKQVCEFRRGDVYARSGTKAERAVRRHFEGWMDAAVLRERDRWMSRIAVLSGLGPEDAIQPVIAGEPRDEPTALLERAVREWRRDAAKLLIGRDLALLLLTAGGMTFGDDDRSLIVHSALRRKATLWHWLARFAPDNKWVQALLLDAVAGRDRDKSDAGRSIVDVSACVLDDAQHADVIAALRSSTYAHFNEAAAAGAERAAVVDRLREIRAARLRGHDLRSASATFLDNESGRLLQVLVADGRHTAEVRDLGRLGLEVFARSPLGRVLDRD
jgi:hypothetical protein